MFNSRRGEKDMPGKVAQITKNDFRPPVLTEQISQILMKAILEGSLRHGDQLVETELQKQFGISRSPLREAFRDLEKKGLVVIIPRRGTFVRDVTRQDVEENFPVRATLEALAARQALAKISRKTLREMEVALSKMKRAGETGDATLYRENHNRFHDLFIMASGNGLLTELLKTLRVHRMWYFLAYHYHKEKMKTSLAEHERILDLLSNEGTNPEELESLVRRHIEGALEGFLEVLEEQGNLPDRDR
jgi:DNA-binding GntR family transcriptional regulator